MSSGEIKAFIRGQQRVYMRRRLLEHGAHLAGWAMGIAALIAFVNLVTGGNMVLTTLLSSAGVAWLGFRGWRLHRASRASLDELAVRLDRHGATSNLLTTALAVERGDAHGDEEFAMLAMNQARRQLTSLDFAHFAPVRLDIKPLVVGMMCAGTVLVLYNSSANAYLDGIVNRAYTNATRSTSPEDEQMKKKLAREEEKAKKEQPLTKVARERLEQDARALESLAKEETLLTKSAKESLEKAAKALREAAKEKKSAREALKHMAQAKRQLKELKKQSDKGEHLDKELLQKLGDKDLAEQIAKAESRKDRQKLGALAKELARRLEKDSAQDMNAKAQRESLAKALEEAIKNQSKKGAGQQGDSKQAQASAGEQSDAKKSSEDSRLRRKSDRDSGDASTSNAMTLDDSRQLAQLLRQNESEPSEDGARDKLEQLSRDGEQSGERGEVSRTAQQKMQRIDEEKSEQMQRARSSQKGGDTPPPCESEDPEDCMVASMDQQLRSRGKTGEQGGQQGKSGQGSKQGQGQSGKQGSQSGEGGQSEGQGGGQGQGEGTHPASSGASSKAASNGISRGGTPSASPGGGAGGRDGKQGLSRDSSASSTNWVKSQWKDGGRTIVRTIKSVSRGERHTVGYKDVHETYEEIAEEKTKQEAIPLKRRDFIRQYFESIRPE